ncbi:WD40 domain-containing putative histone [Encephalitozoon romaleae SJ-2008]|uniref:WD40 domain-containing putative histone n=1 Tax=Encephalitozoon romaleae (strain SJ-2008) TaxID=1178016 RepID=I6ZH68_ENCRO|nr:WD40 domain-containing putative histone [Encephalitozoon romaleae SJ-2008]AFN82538.1 WD40 domain-containing putative histone [Encephalitozoon romaleae SJ-2008]
MRVLRTGINHGTKRPKPIFSIDVSDGHIVTSSLGGEIKLWNPDYECIRTIKKHQGTVLCVRFSVDGDLFASGGDDGMVFVYKRNGDVVGSTSEHENDVSNVIWTDRFLVSVGYDGYVVLYDQKSLDVAKKMRPHEGQIKGICVDKSFRYMCTQGDDGIVLYEEFKVVKKVDASEGVILESFFSRMSWTPDGEFFASGLSFNRNYNTVEVFNKDLRNECSLIGHAAPCEVVAFSPVLYKKDRKYYVAAVSSQDLSLSLWCSLSAKPFLLIKNLTELPVLDMCWNESGTRLLVCSYGGEVVQIDVEDGDFGKAYEEEEDSSGDIFFSVENRDIFERTKESPEESNDQDEPVQNAKKIVKPVLISSDPTSEETKAEGAEITTEHSYLAIFNYCNRKIEKLPRNSQMSKSFGDFNVELSKDRTYVSVKRGPKEFYKIYGSIEMMCVNKKHICLYTGKIQIYNLMTGVLSMPFICAGDVVTMDVLGKRLAYLQADGFYTVLSIGKRKIDAKGMIPRTGDLLSLRLDRKYFVVASFPDEEYFLEKRSGVWLQKTPVSNSIWAGDTDLTLEYDETLSHLENEFLISHLVKDKERMIRALKRITKAACKMKKMEDFIELKLKNIITMLLEAGERSKAVEILGKMNTNYVLQQFVFSMLKEIGTIKL